MSDGGILREEDEREFESYLDETSGHFHALLECIGKTISKGIEEGRFTEKQVQKDLDVALWIAYACNNIDDYEHYVTSCEWLSRVEDEGKRCGVWYYRYANALLYCGKPRLAMEYVQRGVSVDPNYPWCWLTLGRLKAHHGDLEGAMDAAETGLRLIPDNWEFETLKRDIEGHKTLEEMEFHFIHQEDDEALPDDVRQAFSSADPEIAAKAEAVMGMVVDQEGLAKMKEALSPEGWIPDHPYCTFMRDYPGGQTLVTMTMNEAFLSKLSPSEVKAVLDSVPGKEAAARETLGEGEKDKHLYGVSVDRHLGVLLSFGSFGDENPVTVAFDPNGEMVRREFKGEPFVALLLLEDAEWDPEKLKKNLASEWGIRCTEGSDGSNLVFEVDGELAAYSLMASPVPYGEAEEKAANNYLWPEAVETASRHKAHLMVALINHGMDPVESALIHTRLVASACMTLHVLGVYIQNTVLRTEDYLAEAELMRDAGELPVMDWVWVGIYRSESGRINAYTMGMNVFGKDEMEIIDADDSPEGVRTFMYDVINHLLVTDSVLSDGDMIGISDDEVVTVTVSEGLSVEGRSVKLGYARKG